MSASVTDGPVDLTDPDINAVALPHKQFAELRRTAPVCWVDQEPAAYAGLENCPGYWAVTRHADVAAISKNSKEFSTWENTVIIRWATPVSVFQRTALNDVEVGGQLVEKGQRVGLFYASANFDADVFEDAHSFDITRNPNPHLSFGGHGAHYCIGANLARMEVDLIFNAIADIMPDISKEAEPRRLRHAWINGIKELQVSYA